MVHWTGTIVIKYVTTWTTLGLAFGAGSALLADVNMLGVLPCLPGIYIGSLISARPSIVTDAGVDLAILLPSNSIMYGIVGTGIGLWRGRPRNRDRLSPQCAECGYCLIGNRSWVCPECGTEFAPITESMRGDARKVADLVERYMDGAITWQKCMDEMNALPPEMFDRFDLASELYYEVEHEPKVGGFFGWSKERAAARHEQMRGMIESLRSAAQG